MIVPDVNLLVYAVITGFPEHQNAHAWWERTLNGSAAVGLAAPAVFGFVRIVTNGRLLDSPLSVSEAVEYVREWLAQPSVEFLESDARQRDTALDLLMQVGAAANLTTDAQLAAYALVHDAEICSNDADFGRFTGVKWSNPLRDR